MDKKSNFVDLKNASRIWAVGSIHSNLKSFNSIKNFIIHNFKKQDKIVFLGNVIGLGNFTKETLSSIINLRSILMSKYFLKPDDIVFLRGAQEEMFSKILQLHTAPNPIEIIDWMFEHGVDKTLNSYGFEKAEVINIASSGTVSISKWISKLNKELINNPGHKEYFLNLKHAAYSTDKRILFVNRLEAIKFQRCFDLIVSNPPYVSSSQLRSLAEDIKKYEPTIALNGGYDGLDVIKKVIYKVSNILKIKGMFALEIGNGQYLKVSQILKDKKFREKKLIKDYRNNIRCIISILDN